MVGWRVKWSILCIGKPALGYAREGVAFYLDRLRPLARVECAWLKAGGGAEAEGQRLWQRSEGCLRLVLDERGALPDTAAAAARVRQWRDTGAAGPKRVSILIGGADGHAGWVRERADEVWALSRLTLQHELALLVMCEQLYRIHSLLAGGPYHREG